MIKFKFKSNLSQVVYRWPQLFINGSRNGLKEYLTRLVTETRSIFGMVGALQKRTGKLDRSIRKSQVKRIGDNLEGTVGSPIVYAPVHEFGAKITPKKGKYLVFNIATGITNQSNRWSWKTTTTGKERYRRTKESKNLIFAKSVTIPARPYLSRALDNTKEGGARMIQDAIIKEINK